MPERTLRQRIGGRWAVSVPGFVAIAVLAVLTSASVDSLHDGGRLRVLLLANIGGVAAMGAVMWLAHLTVFRNRAIHPVPVWSVALVGAIACAMRLVVVVPVGEAAGVPTDHVGLRIAIALFVGALLLPASAAFIDSFETAREQRRLLVRRAADLKRGEAGGTALAEAMTDAAFREVAEAASLARSELDASSAGGPPEQRLAAATRLRQVVETSLRPLSHRLYAIQSEPLPRISAWPAIRAAFREHALQPVAAGIVVAVTALPVALTYPWPGAAVRPLIGGVQVAVELALVIWVARRVAVVRRHMALIGVVVAVLGSTLRLVVVSALGIEVGGPAVVVASAVLTAAAVLATGFVAAAVRGERAAGATLEGAVSAREVEAHVAALELARVSRDLAQHLHGTVQAHLLAAAFAMEQATRDGDAAAFSQVVDSARRALDADAAMASPRRGLRAELEHRVSLWSGFLDVTLDIDPGLDELPPDACADIGRIVEEAVGNAHKHGDATRAHVSVAPDPSGAVGITIRDDGSGPQAAAPGMGSAFLDFVAPGGWELAPGPTGGGAVLRVRLPVRTPDGLPVSPGA